MSPFLSKATASPESPHPMHARMLNQSSHTCQRSLPRRLQDHLSEKRARSGPPTRRTTVDGRNPAPKKAWKNEYQQSMVSPWFRSAAFRSSGDKEYLVGRPLPAAEPGSLCLLWRQWHHHPLQVRDLSRFGGDVSCSIRLFAGAISGNETWNEPSGIPE